ncbi:50S ribosomal protein L44 [miscellaneous Crenarchaeota group-15 archaeon DG-45]|uniref:Large ribosomal subunit protein eL42 n=1 Tax=miscellaneous Crenarchaeota group-15 archaeon DG-45 TaxID=1685127 RepID=A0A0M0BN74_9ARCH|nr:MAG: 50S ribosomal protein L44 [miscellaneous Crenarchaeota group-15 archaeon DG-45]
MKAPRTMRTYCPRCNSHTEFSVSIYKAGKRKGAKLGERRQEERKKGYGGQKFPLQHNQAKTTRKMTLKLQCRKCGYTLQRQGMRLKKLEVE